MCHAYIIVHNLLYVHRVFCLTGNGSISHERLKLSKKCFNNVWVEKGHHMVQITFLRIV